MGEVFRSHFTKKCILSGNGSTLLKRYRFLRKWDEIWDVANLIKGYMKWWKTSTVVQNVNNLSISLGRTTVNLYSFDLCEKASLCDSVGIFLCEFWWFRRRRVKLYWKKSFSISNIYIFYYRSKSFRRLNLVRSVNISMYTYILEKCEW